MTIREELERIFRPVMPFISLHDVNDYRTQLESLDQKGMPSKKMQNQILFMLCQRLEELEERVKLSHDKSTTTDKPDAKTPVQSAQ